MEKPEKIRELGKDCPGGAKLVWESVEESLMREIERTGEVSRIAAELERRVDELEAELRERDGRHEWATEGSKLVWEWGNKSQFKAYYDRKMMCPYVLCLNGQVHAMFSSLEDVETYVWECW